MNNWQHSSYNSFHSAIALVAGGTATAKLHIAFTEDVCSVLRLPFELVTPLAFEKFFLIHIRRESVAVVDATHDCWIFDEKRMRILNAYCVFLSQAFYTNSEHIERTHIHRKIVFITVIVYAHTLIDRNEYFSERKRRTLPTQTARKRFERTKYIFRTQENSINFFARYFLCANYR